MKEKIGSKEREGQKPKELPLVLKWANGVQAARVTVLLLGSSGHTANHAGSTCLF